MDLQHEVVAYIRREGLLRPGDKVVVGVSGGPDSLCLLHVMWANRDALQIEIHVAHLNHQLRGAEADEDARFVAATAAAWGLPCTVEAHDVGALAHEHKIAIEEAARRARYAFLWRAAGQTGAGRVAVAHNADDQSETVVMHWLRGSGLAGLRGMLPAVRLSALRLLERPGRAVPAWLIRPLLETPRAAIEAYNEAHGLAPRFDRSNLDTTLYRNKLRHELIPYLERAYKPNFPEIVRRSARVIRDDYDLLCTLRDGAWQETVRSAAGEAVVFRREAWRALHPALQRGTIRKAVQQLRWSLRDVGFVHVEAAMRVAVEGDAGAQATLPDGLALIVGYETIAVAEAGYRPPPEWPALTVARVELQVPGTTALPGDGEATIELLPRGQLPAGWALNADPWRAYLDADVTGTKLALRRRKEGDRFCPLGLGGRHKLVSELLVNEKVPAYWRDEIPLLVRADGEIMWVCGQRIDERARIRADTSQAIAIELCTPGKGLADV
jgi:tRNA(Ile)-lysidine synthase